MLRFLTAKTIDIKIIFNVQMVTEHSSASDTALFL